MKVLDDPSRRNVLRVASAAICTLFANAAWLTRAAQAPDPIDASQAILASRPQRYGPASSRRRNAKRRSSSSARKTSRKTSKNFSTSPPSSKPKSKKPTPRPRCRSPWSTAPKKSKSSPAKSKTTPKADSSVAPASCRRLYLPTPLGLIYQHPPRQSPAPALLTAPSLFLPTSIHDRIHSPVKLAGETRRGCSSTG